MPRVEYSKIITVNPERYDGAPCIRNMRFPVSQVLWDMAAGVTEEKLLADFPYLTRDDIRACLAYAADEHAFRE